MKSTFLLLMLSACAAWATTGEQTNKTFKVESGGTVIVDVDWGSIEIIGQASPEVVVDVSRNVQRKSAAEEAAYLRENPVTMVQEGNTITVRCRHKKMKNWLNWGSDNRNDGKYTLRVPREFNASLETAGGEIAATDLAGRLKAGTSGGRLQFTRVHGPLEGETSGGNIRLVDCEGAIRIETSGGIIDVNGGSGSLKGETSGGSVTVKEFGGPVSVETSGGGITIENVKGKVDGSTSGGSVNAVLLSPLPGEVNLSTSGGGVTVKVPENAAFDLNAETSAGIVWCDLSAATATDGKRERREMKGKVNGGGPTVRLRTSAGNIQVKKL